MAGTSTDQHMHVIAGAVNDQGCAAQFPDDAAQIREKSGTNVWTDQRLAQLGAEDQVNNDIAAGLRHFSFALSGLAAFSRH